MLSNKLTFSLTCLVLLLGLVFMAPQAAMAFGVKLSLDETVRDVSDKDGFQVYSGRNRVTPYPESVNTGGVGVPTFIFLIQFEKVVQLVNDADDTVTPSGAALGLDDLTVDAWDDLDRALGTLSLATVLEEDGGTPADNSDDVDLNGDGDTDDDVPVATIEHKTPGATFIADPGELPGRQFRVTVNHLALENAYPGSGGSFEIHKLLFNLRKEAAAESSLDAITKLRKEGTALPLSGYGDGNRLFAELVGADEGNPHYRTTTGNLDITVLDPLTTNASRADWADDSTGTTASTSRDNPGGYPNVVSITKLTGVSRDITILETEPFDVKIVLTEEPHKDYLGDNGTKLVEVTGGKATAITPGLTFGTAGEGVREANTDSSRTAASLTAAGINAQDAELAPLEEGDYAVTTISGVGHGTDGTANTAESDPVPEPTGRDNKYYTYRVKIQPNDNYEGNVIITVKRFKDNTLPIAKWYLPVPRQEIASTQLADGIRTTRLKNGREILTVPVKTRKSALTTAQEARDTAIKNETNAIRLTEKQYIPANGYLVLARGADATVTGIVNSPIEKYSDDANTTLKLDLTPAQQKYNIQYGFGFPPPAVDLYDFFRNGGTVQLLHKNATGNTTGVEKKKGYPGAKDTEYTAGQVVISEIMWAQDAGGANSQYIELHNTTSDLIGIDKDEWVLVFFGPSGGSSALGTAIDTVGNTGWSADLGADAAVPGSNGVTTATPSYPTVSDLVSMSRIDMATSGNTQSNWTASERPVHNLTGRRIGSPGAANSVAGAQAKAADKVTDDKAAADKAAKAAAAAAKVSVATGSDIMISEIMVASNNGRLPQWIELANLSGKEVSLSGWTLVINNDPADTDVVGGSISIDIGDVVVGVDAKGRSESVLIVSKAGRSSGIGIGKGDLRADRIVDVQSQVSPGEGRYMLLSEMGFKISLVVPPATGGVITNGDVVGNLGMNWELPMAEGNRSSLIRREMGNTAEIMGTDAAGWMLASDTMMDGAYRDTYYGQSSDVGTPGYDAGGALPVELSKFNAARDRLTGQVTITWETQSELNNAGFYIKRSQQKTGQFVAVNPTMIAGAGTTSEKQSYTYTDTTAQPNIVYYYQIEDVSLDGNRQTLTRAHRLKGHIGAAGKLTTMWGELKERE